MAKEDDIRYRGTERAIRKAYLRLAKTHRIEDISVTKLCDVAHISRNAFYQHYSNINELFTTMVNEVVKDIRAQGLESSDRVLSSGELDIRLSASIIDALSAHEDLLRIVLPTDSGALSCHLADGIADAYIAAALKFGEHGSSIEHTLSCSFAAWGLIGFLRRWISSTDLPIAEALPYFEAKQLAISDKATDYLLKK